MPLLEMLPTLTSGSLPQGCLADAEVTGHLGHVVTSGISEASLTDLFFCEFMEGVTLSFADASMIPSVLDVLLLRSGSQMGGVDAGRSATDFVPDYFASGDWTVGDFVGDAVCADDPVPWPSLWSDDAISLVIESPAPVPTFIGSTNSDERPEEVQPGLIFTACAIKITHGANSSTVVSYAPEPCNRLGGTPSLPGRGA